MWPFHKKAEPKIKQYLYILLFSLLGWMVLYLFYAMLEYLVLSTLLEDFDKNSLGLTWGQWWYLNHLVAAVFSLAGITIGFLQGRYWWRVVYIDHKLKRCQ